MLGYLSADTICSGKRTVFRERSSKKTVSLEAQIYVPGQISEHVFCKVEAIVFIILQVFFRNTRGLKIGSSITL